MYRAQAKRWAVAEAGFGNDAQEAEYAAALRRGDTEAIAACEAAAQERMARARRITE
jgi:hypothetical protein